MFCNSGNLQAKQLCQLLEAIPQTQLVALQVLFGSLRKRMA